MEQASRTLTICDMLYLISSAQCIDHAANETPSTVGSCIDGDEFERPFWQLIARHDYPEWSRLMWPAQRVMPAFFIKRHLFDFGLREDVGTVGTAEMALGLWGWSPRRQTTVVFSSYVSCDAAIRALGAPGSGHLPSSLLYRDEYQHWRDCRAHSKRLEDWVQRQPHRILRSRPSAFQQQ